MDDGDLSRGRRAAAIYAADGTGGGRESEVADQDAAFAGARWVDYAAGVRRGAAACGVHDHCAGVGAALACGAAVELGCETHRALRESARGVRRTLGRGWRSVTRTRSRRAAPAHRVRSTPRRPKLPGRTRQFLQEPS